MNVAGPELRPQAVPVAGEREERVKAVLPKMTIERHFLLLSVCRVFRRINVYDQPLLLLSPHESVVGPHKRSFEGLQSGLSSQVLILKPRQPGLTSPSFVALTNGEPKRGINSQKIGVVAVLITSRYLIDPLANHLKLRVFAVNPGSGILQVTPDWTQDAETLVYLSQQKETCVRGNLGTLKIYHDCRIEFGSNCFSLLFTTPGHLITLSVT